MKDFKNKVVIVTGGGNGIGKEITLNFLNEGAKVIVFDYNREAGEKLTRELNDSEDNFKYITVDITNKSQVVSAVDDVIELWGTIDILINNAGIGNPKLAETLTTEEWDNVLNVNLTGVFNCSSAVIPMMKKNRYGKILNIASAAGSKRISYASGIAYTTSKTGIIGFTRHLAYELAHYGINVNCVCPGSTMTPLFESITDSEIIKERISSIPKGRLCTPKDISNTIAFLASDKADMICGVALDVDGGALLGWMSTEEYYDNRTRISNERF